MGPADFFAEEVTLKPTALNSPPFLRCFYKQTKNHTAIHYIGVYRPPPQLPPTARRFLVCLPSKPMLTLQPTSPYCRENCSETTTMMRQQEGLVQRDFVLHKFALFEHGKGWQVTQYLPVYATSAHAQSLCDSLETRAVSCGQCQVGLERSGVTNVLTESKVALVFATYSSLHWSRMVVVSKSVCCQELAGKLHEVQSKKHKIWHIFQQYYK